MTLTSDLISRFGIKSGAYLLYSLKLVYECILGWQSVAYLFHVTVSLTSDLVSGIIMS